MGKISLDLRETKNSFEPQKKAWLVTLPDGNYDDCWNNETSITRLERVVNDAISVAIPGAIDKDLNFCAYKEPESSDWLNYNDNVGSRRFCDKRFLFSKIILQAIYDSQ